MAFKKTIASYLKDDGTWQPQKEVAMHPLEEAEIRAHWAIHDVVATITPIPSTDEQMSMIVSQGVEEATKNINQLKQLHVDSKLALDKVIEASKEATRVWHEHVEFCLNNGLDPDTHGIEL